MNAVDRTLESLELIMAVKADEQDEVEDERHDVAEQHRQVLARSKEDYLAEVRARHSRRSREIIELFAQARYQTKLPRERGFLPCFRGSGAARLPLW